MTALRTQPQDDVVALVAHPSLASAASQVVSAARATSTRSLHVTFADTDPSAPTVSALSIGSPPSGGGIDRALVMAPDQHSATGLAHHALRLGAPAAAIETAIVHPPDFTVPHGGEVPFVVLRRGGGAAPLLADTDAARLGRQLVRARLGLALGAGGAWGFAHLGALEVLDEAGYQFDIVAGTSVGALVGALVAMRRARHRIASDMRRIFSPEASRELFGRSLAGTSPGRERMVELLRDICDERTLESLPIPLAVAAVDLDARRALALTRGSLWQALAASTALPGLYPPWERNGRRLVDAFALHPVPTAYLADLGADVTVAIDLLGGAGEAPARPSPPRGAAARMMSALAEVLDIAALDAGHRQSALADVVMRPAFCASTWRDVELAEHFLDAGREAARQQLPALRALIKPNQPPQGGAHG